MRTALATTACAAVILLAGCSSTATSPSSGAPASPAAAKSSASKPLTATTALEAIAVSVKSVKLTGTVTAANDSNHLLGRPSQYTSKVTFSDSRISKGDASVFSKGDVELGGAIEVFGSPDDAKARAKYIQTVTKSMPGLAEYDYVHGSIVVRVSRFLTPAQAGEYKAAAAKLG
jgi:hypothetical protein